MSTAATLSLYRQLLRAGMNMPTAHRREFVWKSSRSKFEKNRNLQGQDLDDALSLGACMLDQVLAQQKHLQECKRAGLLDRELLPQEY